MNFFSKELNLLKQGGHRRRSVLAKRSKVYAKAVKYGTVYRLMFDKDNYITANKKM